ncbi:transposase [Alkalibacterium psychrotolerans]
MPLEEWEEATIKNRRQRRVFSKEFKKKVVALYTSGKARKDIIAEYDLTPSAFDKWVKEYRESDITTENNTLTSKEVEIMELRKEIERLKAENESLKEVVMIFARHS